VFVFWLALLAKLILTRSPALRSGLSQNIFAMLIVLRCLFENIPACLRQAGERNWLDSAGEKDAFPPSPFGLWRTSKFFFLT
jgi:hypothetical protein